MTELPDRLLREALRAGTPPTPSNVCIDAEALAAWADGTMSGAGRATFETHAADCARCQALMAAMVQTEPPKAQAEGRRPVFSWLMPLAAATAALAVVVSLAVAQRRASQSQQARTQPAATSVSPAEDKAPAVAVPQAAASPDTASRRERPASTAASAAQANAAAPRSAAARPDAGAAAALQDAAAKTEARAKEADRRALTPAVTPPSVSPAPAAAPAPPAGASAAADATRVPVAAGTSPAPPTGVAFGALAAKGLSTRNEPTLIASPARDSQWRIVNGAVTHSGDGGLTWQAQALGADATVHAGAAPSARVCWLAGARGLVLLTTDGAQWRRIVFPETVDLVAIQATDAAHATVTAATGRRFSTADGGKSWTILPPEVDKRY